MAWRKGADAAMARRARFDRLDVHIRGQDVTIRRSRWRLPSPCRRTATCSRPVKGRHERDRRSISARRVRARPLGLRAYMRGLEGKTVAVDPKTLVSAIAVRGEGGARFERARSRVCPRLSRMRRVAVTRRAGARWGGVARFLRGSTTPRHPAGSTDDRRLQALDLRAAWRGREVC